MRTSRSTTVSVRSFAKINLGLYIGAARKDGFHDLRTIYQIVALHDVIGVRVGRGNGIEILCTNKDPRIPLDASNTCFRMAERVLDAIGLAGKIHVSIEIDKRLPVQGGLGAGSSNAVATLVGLELALSKKDRLTKKLSVAERLRIAADIGSDLPLFVIGGTSLGVGRGEEVYPLPDLPAVPVVVVMPEVGVSTAQAFADWDASVQQDTFAEPRSAGRISGGRIKASGAKHAAGDPSQLTRSRPSDRLFEVGCLLSSWLTGSTDSGLPNTGASAKGGSRAGSLPLGLVRTGIENDFEKVVFPQYPELRDIKGALERAGAKYASLSGSGSTLYGLFRSQADASRAAKRLQRQGVRAVATTTLTRQQYWKQLVVDVVSR